MALQRSIGTSSLLNAIRKAEDQRLTSKEVRVPGKMADAAGPRLTRAALRNLSNQTSTNQFKPASQKTVNSINEQVKVTRPVRKVIQKESEPLQQQQQQDASTEQCEVQQHSASVSIAKQQQEEQQHTKEVSAEPAAVLPAVLEPEAEAVSIMDISAVSHDGTTGDEVEAFSKEMWRLNVEDIDEGDGNNPQLISEYIKDIYVYMRELEQRLSVRSHCLSNQTEVTGRMRGILIDWLVQVHLRFQLLQETLYLAISILDRYLQVENVTKNKLQLVGVTSMWIASKYEEMYAPEVADFVYITDNAYTAAQMRHMECCILKALDFQLGRPLPIHFLRRNSKAADADVTIHTLAKYLMELTVVEYDMAHIRPSELAAAALCLSLKLINNAPWSATLVYYSCYTEAQLLPTMRRIADLVLNAGTGRLTAIKTKYQSSKLMRISRSPLLASELLTELSAHRQLTSS